MSVLCAQPNFCLSLGSIRWHVSSVWRPDRAVSLHECLLGHLHPHLSLAKQREWSMLHPVKLQIPVCHTLCLILYSSAHLLLTYKTHLFSRLRSSINIPLSWSLNQDHGELLHEVSLRLISTCMCLFIYSNIICNLCDTHVHMEARIDRHTEDRQTDSDK